MSSVRSSKLNQKKIHIERDGAMVIGGHNKSVDTTTNQNSVSAVGGTWRRSAIAEEQMGGSILQLLDGGK